MSPDPMRDFIFNQEIQKGNLITINKNNKAYYVLRSTKFLNLYLLQNPQLPKLTSVLGCILINTYIPREDNQPITKLILMPNEFDSFNPYHMSMIEHEIIHIDKDHSLPKTVMELQKFELEADKGVMDQTMVVRYLKELDKEPLPSAIKLLNKIRLAAATYRCIKNTIRI